MESSDLFEMLYDKYFDKIYKSTCLITQNDSIAEDACQEAFIAAFNTFDRLKDIKKFPGWLAAIASNKAIDMIRKNSKIYCSGKLSNMQQTFSHEDPIDLIVDKENRLRIIKAMNKLGLKYREVAILKYYYDLSDKEIGEALDISVAAVKSRLHRAKILLQKLLEPDKKEEGCKII